ncbi:NUDIX domain-containing protein [Chloroflexota bacterium]
MDLAKHRECPSLTVDVVVMARFNSRLKTLLVKRRHPPFEGSWAIPGGFVEPHEPLKEAAERELREETGVRSVDLEQVHTFGDPGRDPRGWIVSVVYLAWLSSEAVDDHLVQAGSDAQDVAWFNLDELPPLAFDHSGILNFALTSVELRVALGDLDI